MPSFLWAGTSAVVHSFSVCNIHSNVLFVRLISPRAHILKYGCGREREIVRSDLKNPQLEPYVPITFQLFLMHYKINVPKNILTFARNLANILTLTFTSRSYGNFLGF